MSYLTPRGRDLIRAGREAFQPSDTDRIRIQEALAAKLGETILPPDMSSTATALVAGRSLWPILSIIAVGVGLFGGAFYLTRQNGTPPAIVAPVSPPPEVPTVTVAPIAEPAPAPTPQVPEEKPTVVSPAAATSPARQSQDRLAAEVALLSRATRDLRAGRAADALKALDEHRRRFPKALLDEEQRTARAQVLCALGRFDEAHAKIAELDPQSPATARAKQYCDGRLAAR